MHKAKGRTGSSKIKMQKIKQIDAIGEITRLMSKDKDEDDIIIGKLDVNSTVKSVLTQIKTDKATARAKRQLTKEQAQKLTTDIFRTTSAALWESLEKQLKSVNKEGKPMHLLRVDEFLARVGIPLKSQHLQLPAGENLKETARFDDTIEHVIRWLTDNEPGHYQHSIQHQIPLIYSWERLHRKEEELDLMSTELGEITHGPLAITEIARDLNILTQAQFDILKWKSQVEKKISLPIFQEITRRVNGIDDLVWHEYERQIMYHIDIEKGPKFGRLNHNDIELQRSLPSTDAIGQLLQLPSHLHYAGTMAMTAMETLPASGKVRHKMHKEDTHKETREQHLRSTAQLQKNLTEQDEELKAQFSRDEPGHERSAFTTSDSNRSIRARSREKQQHLQKKKDNVTKDQQHLQKEKNEFTENKLNPKESDLELEEAKITVRADSKKSKVQTQNQKTYQGIYLRESESITEPPWYRRRPNVHNLEEVISSF